MDREEKMVVALTGCSHALSHGTLLIFPTVLLLLQKEFSLGYLELGVIGNIMTFTYGLGALPGGMIYNYLSPKKLYLFCFLGCSVTLILVAFSNNLTLFITGLAMLGAFGSIYHPWANALITSKVREYGRALGIHGAAGNIGLVATPFVAGLIASYLGWRHVFFIFALPGIIVSLWALFVNMSPRAEVEKEPLFHTERSASGTIRTYFSLPLVLLYLANMMHSFSFSGSLTFLPAYMAKRTSFHIFSFDSVALGGMLSAIVLSMGIFGQYGGGILSQKPHLEKKFLIISVIAFPFIFAMSFTTNHLLLILALIFFFFNFFLQPMNNTLLALYTPREIRGTAFGIFFFVAFGFGSLASSFSGFIAQEFGLQWVFMGLSGSAFLLIFIALFILRNQKNRPMFQPAVETLS
jgi:FSR family fosmidomycin resistance protein-like MFS transporter